MERGDGKDICKCIGCKLYSAEFLTPVLKNPAECCYNNASLLSFVETCGSPRLWNRSTVI